MLALLQNPVSSPSLPAIAALATACPHVAAAPPPPVGVYVDLQKFQELLKLASAAQRPPSVSIAAATTAMLDAKRAANKSPRYIKALKEYLNQFKRGREAMLVCDVDTALLEQWFAGRDEKPRTKATGINRLNTLFSFCRRRKWCLENPCDNLEKVTIDLGPPQIFTPDEVDTLLAICKPRSIPWLVLGLFCGLRPEAEVENLPRENIDLEMRRVKVVCEAAGGGKRRGVWRFVPIPDRALKLLKKHLPRENEVLLRGPASAANTSAFSLQPSAFHGVCPSHSTVRRDRREMRNFVDRKWPADILRHTAASYWLALTGDIGKCATIFGNSPKVFSSHYNGLATPEDARRFFGSPSPTSAFSPQPSALNLKALKFLSRHLDHPEINGSLIDLAKLVGLGLPRENKVFHSHLNQTPKHTKTP
jgi:integrase